MRRFTDQQETELVIAALPLMQWLEQNGHPHMKAVVDNESVEITEALVRALKRDRDPDALDKINRELDEEIRKEIAEMAAKRPDPDRDAWIAANMQHPLWRAAFAKEVAARKVPSFVHPGEKAQDQLAMHGVVANVPVPPSLVKDIERVMAIVRGVNEMSHAIHYVGGIDADTGLPTSFGDDRSKALVMRVDEAKSKAVEWTKRYADIVFHADIVSDIGWKKHVDKLACVCGGLIFDKPTGIETILTCAECGRTFLDEFELAAARKSETKGGTKCADATYYTTGTLIGSKSVPVETEINLNGRRETIRAKDGKFVLTYEQIVRMAVNQKRTEFNKFAGTDAELPMLTCTYRHRVEFSSLPGERSGTLWKGKSVECTPGMCIDAMDTSNA
jgi:hypothetical protein